jgi:catechol 2,3-dioxygenase-like lactoylglutathione lyase family enzyme
MIGYVTLGTCDLARGATFYDAIAKELGVGRMGGSDRFIAWGTPGGAAGIGLALPYDGKPATVGNGVMVALEAKDREQVDRIYKLALSLGGTDEGPPGQRFEGFYAAYFRDLDGNKLNAYVMG